MFKFLNSKEDEQSREWMAFYAKTEFLMHRSVMGWWRKPQYSNDTDHWKSLSGFCTSWILELVVQVACPLTTNSCKDFNTASSFCVSKRVFLCLNRHY